MAESESVTHKYKGLDYRFETADGWKTATVYEQDGMGWLKLNTLDNIGQHVKDEDWLNKIIKAIRDS